MFIIVFLICSSSIALSLAETSDLKFVLYQTNDEMMIILKDKDNWIDCTKVNTSRILNIQPIEKFAKAGIHIIKDEDLSSLSQKCNDLHSSNENVDSANSLIVPGTKWCGAGNKAKKDSDFGIFRKTDECCQQRHKCYPEIKTGEIKYDIINPGPFAMKGCKCDQELRECLLKSECLSASFLGKLFFTIFETPCLNCSEDIIPLIGEGHEGKFDGLKCHSQDQEPYEDCLPINESEKNKSSLNSPGSSAHQHKPYEITLLFIVFIIIVDLITV